MFLNETVVSFQNSAAVAQFRNLTQLAHLPSWYNLGKFEGKNVN
jgi:hypothetical protein